MGSLVEYFVDKLENKFKNLSIDDGSVDELGVLMGRLNIDCSDEDDIDDLIAGIDAIDINSESIIVKKNDGSVIIFYKINACRDESRPLYETDRWQDAY